ncbi:MAG: ribosomal protein L11 methyltransferase [Cyclobacteriaceae bacterium]|nr:MAG: ribosomal protein L11 methyltransferase [Cyclobacteriaceae bacterium]
MDFVEIDINCQGELKDILTAELNQLGYESFLDTDAGFRAYQPLKNHNPAILGQLFERYALDTSFKSKKLTDRNWNELWEKTFEPIEIDNQCRIRASFHRSNADFSYEIVIDPKMAFGTGHHETTRQVIEFQLAIDHSGKSVMDIGCGTGILSIMAEMKGAAEIYAVDNDPYAVNNTVENMILNGCKRINVKEGTINDIPPNKRCDLIVANINRNVLLNEIHLYKEHLVPGGQLILSGFYTFDLPVIVKKCEAESLEIEKQSSENQWACVLLTKNKLQ